MQVLAGDVIEAADTAASFAGVWLQLGGLSEGFNWEARTVINGQEGYPLRPELGESLYYLYKCTRMQLWRDFARNMVRTIETRTKAKCGYAAVRSLKHASHGKVELSNRMDSFFLSETLKYLYLTFAEDGAVERGISGGERGRNASLSSSTSFVFNTEGHPLPIIPVEDKPALLSKKCQRVDRRDLFQFGASSPFLQQQEQVAAEKEKDTVTFKKFGKLVFELSPSPKHNEKVEDEAAPHPGASSHNLNKEDSPRSPLPPLPLAFCQIDQKVSLMKKKTRAQLGAGTIEVGGVTVPTATFSQPRGGRANVVLLEGEVEGIESASSRYTEYTWFEGYAWEAVICSKSRHQAGWKFTPTGEAVREGGVFFAILASEIGPQGQFEHSYQEGKTTRSNTDKKDEEDVMALLELDEETVLPSTLPLNDSLYKAVENTIYSLTEDEFNSMWDRDTLVIDFSSTYSSSPTRKENQNGEKEEEERRRETVKSIFEALKASFLAPDREAMLRSIVQVSGRLEVKLEAPPAIPPDSAVRVWQVERRDSEMGTDVNVKPSFSFLSVSALFSTIKNGGTAGSVSVASPMDACKLSNEENVRGSVVVVRRGGCTFLQKARQVQNMGGIGMIVINSKGASHIQMAGANETDTGSDIEIPAVLILHDEGSKILETLASGEDVVLEINKLGTKEENAGIPQAGDNVVQVARKLALPSAATMEKSRAYIEQQERVKAANAGVDQTEVVELIVRLRSSLLPALNSKLRSAGHTVDWMQMWKDSSLLPHISAKPSAGCPLGFESPSAENFVEVKARGAKALFSGRSDAPTEKWFSIVSPSKDQAEVCEGLNSIGSSNEVLVVKRGGCKFMQKALNAYNAGYGACIVYNSHGENLLIMRGDQDGDTIPIPSVFVTRTVGELLGLLSATGVDNNDVCIQIRP